MGSIIARLVIPKSVEFSVDTAIVKALQNIEIPSTESLETTAPAMQFAEIKIPVERQKIITRAPAIEKIESQIEVVADNKEEIRVISKSELPFYEPVTLKPVQGVAELSTELVAQYKDFAFDENQVAVVEDDVSTSLAAATEIEPEFFDYSSESIKTTKSSSVVTDLSKEETALDKEEIGDEIEEVAAASIKGQESENEIVEDIVAFDYSPESDKKEQQVTESSIGHSVTQNFGTTNTSYSTNIKKTDFAIDYSEAARKSPRVTSQEKEKNAHKSDYKSKGYPTLVNLTVVGTDLKHVENINGFEIQYQDDQSEALTDYGTGEVALESNLAQTRMTRSVTVLKRGYTPTSTDVILNEGSTKTIVPVIEEEKFNRLMKKFEGRYAVGALLVELDEETELAQVDVPFGKVMTLNKDMKTTKSDDFKYQLFLGIKAGNALLTFKRSNGEVVSKIVHVHENEVTFDANYYENVVNEKVKLYEEDLLSKESARLNISADEVKVFAKNDYSSKLNDNTYKLNFGSTHLGGRRYLELTHHEEPVFIGFRDDNNIKVPSENFMRHVLSRFEDSKLGNRCLVQLNLRGKASRIEVQPESVAESLMTYTQMLDNDGKFYDSLSEKTEKIIIVGESHASKEISADGRINVKIEYENGTSQYLNSYCSPNTYLVEQL